jgi:lipoprotein LpqB-like beta-propeller protein/sporulation and spore germination protein
MRRAVAGVAALAVLVSGCAGVPTSSKPQVIGPVQGGPAVSVSPTNTPRPGADPRGIVQEFLRANLSDPVDPRGAHEFLTPEEQRKWSDQTVTILSGSLANVDVNFPSGDLQHAVEIPVSGTQIGSLAPDGTYLPAPPGSGGRGQAWSYQYGLNMVNGQWRISNAPTGLFVSATDFADVYRPIRLYFYDQSEQHLVPDVRYTAKESPQDVATWQLQRLIDGPSNQLGDAVRPSVLNLPTGAHASVTVGAAGTMNVELPGSSHLEDSAKQLLAAQLIANFADDQPQLALTITDAGAPIDIPDFPSPITEAFVKRDSLTASLFSNTDPKPVFYLDGTGRLVTGDDGKPVPGQLGDGLTSAAVAAVNPADGYDVAATMGTGSNQTFWMGNTQTGLHKSNVPIGTLTRPSWAAGLPEAWVAKGATLYRVTGPRAVSSVVSNLPSGDSIAALRLSPDGSRIAMIVQEKQTGYSQLWIVAVVRTGRVYVTNPLPIMPPNYHLSDVAWDDNMTLWVVGTDASQRNSNGIWSLTVDGANIEAQSTEGLPQGADSIATGSGVLPWVSVGGYVFKLGADWEGPNHHTTRGAAPVYLE